MLPAYGSARNPVDMTPSRWQRVHQRVPGRDRGHSASSSPGEVDLVMPVLLQRSAAPEVAGGRPHATARLRADRVPVPVYVLLVASACRGRPRGRAAGGGRSLLRVAGTGRPGGRGRRAVRLDDLARSARRASRGRPCAVRGAVRPNRQASKAADCAHRTRVAGPRDGARRAGRRRDPAGRDSPVRRCRGCGGRGGPARLPGRAQGRSSAYSTRATRAGGGGAGGPGCGPRGGLPARDGSRRRRAGAAATRRSRAAGRRRS